jgi:hypothetical protein
MSLTVSPREHLEFYRVDQSKPTKRILIPAVLLLTVGPPMILVSAALKKFPGSSAMGVVGAALMIAGLVVGFAGIAMLMLDDRYLAVVEGGVLIHLGKEESFFSWDSLEKIHAEEGDLVLTVREQDPFRFPFSPDRLAEIASRLEDWRRKASWNLAPPPPH